MLVILVVPLLLLLAGQDEPPDDLLGGPAVEPPSLVRYTIDGRLRLIEGRPEEAALALLTLDPERRLAAQQIGRDRRLALRRALVERTDLVRRLSDAVRAEDNRRARRITRDLQHHVDGDQWRDPLLDDYAAVLAPDEIASLQSMLDDYWTAWVDRTLRNRPDADANNRDRAAQRLAFQLFQRELREAYDLTLAPYQERLERLFEVIEPTPDQRVAIRTVVLEHIQSGGLHPTDAQRMTAAERIYDELDDDQRRSAFGRLFWLP